MSGVMPGNFRWEPSYSLGLVELKSSLYLAHKKGGGSTRNGRDSKAKRLGVKVFGDAAVNAGGIIIRQRGTKFHAGNNVGMGKDHTLYALVDGVVKFEVKGAFNRQYVKVEPIAA